jgi:hypothetical protein
MDEEIRIVLRAVAEGRGAEVTKTQIDSLKRASEELTEAGKLAYDALVKMGQAPSSRADAINDLRQQAAATIALADAQRELTNTGKGLASDKPDMKADFTPSKTPDAARQALADASIYSAVNQQIAELERNALKLSESGQKAYDALVKLKEPSAKHDAANDTRAQARDQKELADAIANVREKSEAAATARAAAMQNAQAAALAEAAQTSGRAKVAEVSARYEKADADEKKRHKSLVAELSAAQEKDTEATTKNLTVKQQLRQIMTGLGSQTGALGGHFSSLVAPLTIAAAAVGLVITKIVQYVGHVAKMGQASRDIETVKDRFGDLKIAHEDSVRSADALVRQYDKLKESVSGVTQKLNDMTAELLLQQRLQQELDDAQLEKRLQEIQSDKSLTPQQKLEQTAAAQRDARHRKSDRELTTLGEERNLQERAGLEAGRKEATATAALPGARSAVEKQQVTVERAKADAELIAKQAEDRRVEKEKEREIVKRFAENKSGPEDVGGYAQRRINDPTIPPLQQVYGQEGANKRLAEIDEELKGIGLDKKRAALMAAKAETDLADLKAQQAKIENDILENARIRLEAEKQTAKLTKELQTKKDARAKIEPVVDKAEDIKVQRDVDKAKREAEITKNKALQHELEEKAAETQNPKERATYLRQKADVESEIHRLENEDHPEKKAEVDAANAKREAEADRKNREDLQKDHEKRYGKPGANNNTPNNGKYTADAGDIDKQATSLVVALNDMSESFVTALTKATEAAERATAAAEEASRRTDSNRLS